MAGNGKTLQTLPVTLESETSVDYYITKLNDSIPHAVDKPRGAPAPILVSVDRAGSVKYRKRKKSKRRKKKSNLALEEMKSYIPVLNESVKPFSSGSDCSEIKFLRRSSSVSEVDFKRNASDKSIGKSVDSMSVSKQKQEPYVTSAVRRRVKKKNSFQSHRRAIVLEAESLQIEMKEKMFNRLIPDKGNSLSMSEYDPATSSTRQLNRQDALARLDAFMIEVEEATAVAKQQAQEEKGRDPLLRRSYSLHEMHLDSESSILDMSDNHVSAVNEAVPQTLSVSTDSSLQGIFTSLSDRERKVKSSSSVETRHYDRSKSIPGLTIATDTDSLSEIICMTEIDGPQYGRSQSEMASAKDCNYGITHLEQVCKLFEQIGDLRNRNLCLQNQVEDLKQQVKELKEWKEKKLAFNNQDFLNFYTLKRTRPVDRIKDALSRSRKSSVDKFSNTTIDYTGTYQPFNHDSSLATTSFNHVPTNRPVIHSSIRLKKHNSSYLYSKDDLDLSSKGRWKFWKSQIRSIDQTSKKQAMHSLKPPHTQVTIKRPKSFTLDVQLANVHNFDQTINQRHSTKRPISDESSDFEVNRPVRCNSSAAFLQSSVEDRKFLVNRISVKEKPERNNDKDVEEKLKKWQVNATDNTSLHGSYRSSKSADRLDASMLDVEESINETISLRPTKTQVGKSFHNSMPSVISESYENISDTNQLPKVNSFRHSAEWTALQEAFPTTPNVNGKHALSASLSHLIPTFYKKSNNNKRKSWSFAKKATPKYYLPDSGNFSLGTNIEEAGTIGEQFRLQLDHEDVKGVNHGIADLDEVDFLKRHTNHIREKLQAIENEGIVEDSNQGVRQRRPSPLARFHEEQNVHSFLRSKYVDILRLSSFDVLISSPITSSPVSKPAEPLRSFASSPELRESNRGCLNTGDGWSSKPRRHSVTVVRLSCSLPELEMTSSSNLSLVFFPTITQVSSYISQRTPNTFLQQKPRSSTTVGERMKSNNVANKLILLKSNSTDSIHKKSQTDHVTTTEAGPKVRKRTTVKGKFLNQLQRLQKSSMNNPTTFPNKSDISQNSTADHSRQKKKKFHMPSLRSKPLISSKQVEQSTNHKNDVKIDSSAAPVTKQSSKIAHISELLAVDAESSSRRNSASPPHVTKGLVSRLSKRFNHDNSRAEGGIPPKNKEMRRKSASFLSAKNRFEYSLHTDCNSHCNDEALLLLNVNNNNNRVYSMHAIKRAH